MIACESRTEQRTALDRLRRHGIIALIRRLGEARARERVGRAFSEAEWREMVEEAERGDAA